MYNDVKVRLSKNISVITSKLEGGLQEMANGITSVEF